MVVYQAHQEQNELIAYRNDKAAQDQKLAELQKENEKMQKDMAELSALENEVRKALGSNVSQQLPAAALTAASTWAKAALPHRRTLK